MCTQFSKFWYKGLEMEWLLDMGDFIMYEMTFLNTLSMLRKEANKTSVFDIDIFIMIKAEAVYLRRGTTKHSVSCSFLSR